VVLCCTCKFRYLTALTLCYNRSYLVRILCDVVFLCVAFTRTEGVQMETSMGVGSNRTNFQTGLTRMITGQNLMVSDFQYVPPSGSPASKQYGTVALGTDFPAKILKFQLSDYPDDRLICQKGAFLAGSHSINMEMAFTKNFTSGFFGGEGFVLQSLQGSDSTNRGETVFLKAYGTVVKKELKENETLRVSSGSLVAMTSTIDFDVTTLPGFKNVLFGGEGLFVTTLTGPGVVWLQGMPIDRMISEIARKIPSGGGIGLGIPMFGGGGGGEGGGDAAATGATDGEAATEGLDGAGVPVTDAAVEADRNATIASSGMSTSDPDSAESLFGDAAYGGGTSIDETSNGFGTATSGSSEMDSFSTSDEQFAEPELNIPEFEEPTMQEQQFEDDSTFSTFDDGNASGGADGLSNDDGGELHAPEAGEEGNSILKMLWDMFTDDE
jgi:uncharacterized protein (AIM24 family)